MHCNWETGSNQNCWPWKALSVNKSRLDLRTFACTWWGMRGGDKDADILCSILPRFCHRDIGRSQRGGGSLVVTQTSHLSALKHLTFLCSPYHRSVEGRGMIVRVCVCLQCLCVCVCKACACVCLRSLCVHARARVPHQKRRGVREPESARPACQPLLLFTTVKTPSLTYREHHNNGFEFPAALFSHEAPIWTVGPFYQRPSVKKWCDCLKQIKILHSFKSTA